jgi:hypothetical protein
MLFYHKIIHRAFLPIAIVALLTACRIEVFYENYDESGYKEDGLTKAEFIEDFWTCEKHKTRLHKALIHITYRHQEKAFKGPDTIPNAYYRPIKAIGRHSAGTAFYAAVAKCSKCQKEFRKYKRIRKRE